MPGIIYHDHYTMPVILCPLYRVPSYHIRYTVLVIPRLLYRASLYRAPLYHTCYTMQAIPCSAITWKLYRAMPVILWPVSFYTVPRCTKPNKPCSLYRAPLNHGCYTVSAISCSVISCSAVRCLLYHARYTLPVIPCPLYHVLIATYVSGVLKVPFGSALN